MSASGLKSRRKRRTSRPRSALPTGLAGGGQPLGRTDARIIALIVTAVLVGVGIFGYLFHAIGVRAAHAEDATMVMVRPKLPL